MEGFCLAISVTAFDRPNTGNNDEWISSEAKTIFRVHNAFGKQPCGR
jgi:hypothetical protein